ncbi:MAG: hypothetical protein Q4D78_02045 [Neisseria zoodegmatis]|uniref:hypothetical protein n=1 Tax=Neisseria zoodegmatis TaxID=326523 RepID=UPI0026EA7F81|nr:hypothetical protein [Neisseria zoodegmatis]MDO5068970.1 hypothetical protein [Neisseria zoodegmatis]
MNSDTYSALIFALLVTLIGGAYFNRGLRDAGVSANTRAALLAAGAAVIIGCALRYLGLI